jgi:uncharacterized protein YneF (UPF0154 family)
MIFALAMMLKGLCLEFRFYIYIWKLVRKLPKNVNINEQKLRVIFIIAMLLSGLCSGFRVKSKYRKDPIHFLILWELFTETGKLGQLSRGCCYIMKCDYIM